LHCGSDCAKDSSNDDMLLSDFEKALDTIKNPSDDFLVVITGGEPLLRKDIAACGKAIRKRRMRWSMVTNGHLYDAEKHRVLLNAGLGALTISLDGLEVTHNWMRNSEKSFDKVNEAIGLASSTKRLNFDVVTCVNSRNIKELSKIKDYLVSKGVKAWRLFTIIPIGRAADNKELQLSNEDFICLMDFISESRADKFIDVKYSCEGYVGNYELKVREGYYFCKAGIHIASVLIDGSISACPNVDRSFAQGNIYNDNLFEVWNSKFEPFRNRSWTKKGKCANCSEYKNCLGNGFHNWHGNKEQVLVCHNEKLTC
jgi:radical SAM enzyme (rSAM/lipoprotein system)